MVTRLSIERSLDSLSVVCGVVCGGCNRRERVRESIRRKEEGKEKE